MRMNAPQDGLPIGLIKSDIYRSIELTIFVSLENLYYTLTRENNLILCVCKSVFACAHFSISIVEFGGFSIRLTT